jgi:hypothetical protein
MRPLRNVSVGQRLTLLVPVTGYVVFGRLGSPLLSTATWRTELPRKSMKLAACVVRGSTSTPPWRSPAAPP